MGVFFPNPEHVFFFLFCLNSALLKALDRSCGCSESHVSSSLWIHPGSECAVQPSSLFIVCCVKTEQWRRQWVTTEDGLPGGGETWLPVGQSCHYRHSYWPGLRLWNLGTFLLLHLAVTSPQEPDVYRFNSFPTWTSIGKIHDFISRHTGQLAFIFKEFKCVIFLCQCTTQWDSGQAVTEQSMVIDGLHVWT